MTSSTVSVTFCTNLVLSYNKTVLVQKVFDNEDAAARTKGVSPIAAQTCSPRFLLGASSGPCLFPLFLPSSLTVRARALLLFEVVVLRLVELLGELLALDLHHRSSKLQNMFSLRGVVIAACWAIAAGFAPAPSFLSLRPQHVGISQRLETCSRMNPFVLRMAGMPLPPPPPPRRNEFMDEEDQERRRRKSKAMAPEPEAGRIIPHIRFPVPGTDLGLLRPGLWREELGLGLGRLSTKNQPNPKPKVAAPRSRFAFAL